MATFINRLFRRAKSGDPVRKVADTGNLNFVYSVLEDIAGVGCHIEKPTDAGGAGWRIIFDHYQTDELRPDGGPNLQYSADADVNGDKYEACISRSLHISERKSGGKVMKELGLYGFVDGTIMGIQQAVYHQPESGEDDPPLCEFPRYAENLWFLMLDKEQHGDGDGPTVKYWPMTDVMSGWMEVDDKSLELENHGGNGYSSGDLSLPNLPNALRLKGFADDGTAGNITSGDIPVMRYGPNVLYATYSAYLHLFDARIEYHTQRKVEEEITFTEVGEEILRGLNIPPVTSLQAATCCNHSGMAFGHLWDWADAPEFGSGSGGSGLLPDLESAIEDALSSFSSYLEDRSAFDETFDYFSSNLAILPTAWGDDYYAVSALRSWLSSASARLSGMFDTVSALEDAVYNSADTRSVEIDDRISALEAQS